MGLLKTSKTSVKDRIYAVQSKCIGFGSRIVYLIDWIKNGFPDSDVWNLDHSIAKYTLPRLKRLKEIQLGRPGDLSMDEWNSIIDKMIASFSRIVDGYAYEYEDDKEVAEGLDLFRKYYFYLWD